MENQTIDSNTQSNKSQIFKISIYIYIFLLMISTLLFSVSAYANLKFESDMGPIKADSDIQQTTIFGLILLVLIFIGVIIIHINLFQILENINLGSKIIITFLAFIVSCFFIACPAFWYYYHFYVYRAAQLDEKKHISGKVKILKNIAMYGSILFFIVLLMLVILLCSKNQALCLISAIFLSR